MAAVLNYLPQYIHTILPGLRTQKTRTMAGSKCLHVCHSPRDAAMRSVPELNQFVRQNSINFYVNFVRIGI